MKAKIKRVDLDGTVREVNVYVPSVEDDREESLRDFNTTPFKVTMGLRIVDTNMKKTSAKILASFSTKEQAQTYIMNQRQF